MLSKLRLPQLFLLAAVASGVPTAAGDLGSRGIFAPAGSVTALSDVHIWVGSKAGGGGATPVDLYAEFLKNGSVEANALTRCVSGLSHDPAAAAEVLLSWNPLAPLAVSPGDVLALRVSARIGTNPDDTKCVAGHNGSPGVRLYYDGSARPSRFDMTLPPDPNRNLYLRSDGNPCAPAGSAGVTSLFLDGSAPASADAKCRDSANLVFPGGNAFSVIGTWSLPPLLTGANVYVANAGFHLGVPPSVTVYPPSAAGNAAPVRTIAGANTNFNSPEFLFVDLLHNELYVADFFGRAIRVFPLNANGNVAPIRELVDGPNSGLSFPREMVVDNVHNELIVTSLNHSIRVYPRLASGDFPPIRVIQGAGTLLDNPIGLAWDPGADELFTDSYNVGGTNVPGILVFNRTDSGNAAPKRILSGSNTQFGTFTNYLTLDIAHGELLAQGDEGQGILAFNMGDSGNVAPKRNLTGSSTGMSGLPGNTGDILVDDANDRMLVSLVQGSALLVFPRTATGNTKPLMFVMGPATGLTAPSGLATDGPGGFTSYSFDSTVPQAQSQALLVAMNSSVNFTLTATDPDNTAFVFAIITPPAHGLIGNYDGTYGTGSYTPKSGYTGPDSFTFTAFDGVNVSAPVTVTFTVF